MQKTLLGLVGASALSIASAASASVTINFDTPPNTDPGPTKTFGPVTATGYNCTLNLLPCGTTDLYIKDEGAGEQGLGLNNDPTGQHELWGPAIFGRGGHVPFIQLDVKALLGIASGASFSMNSVTGGEEWAVYGSNTPADPFGAFLGSGNDELSHDFAGWGSYDYYDFISLGTSTGGRPAFGNVLVSSLSYTPSVPEPATWAMMLLGFGAMGFTLRRQKRSTKALAQVA